MATIQASPYAPFLTACDKNSRAFFVRVYEKACPFSQQPQLLSNQSGSHTANSSLRWRLPRTADYINGVFLQISQTGTAGQSPSVNTAHKYIKEVKILFNDMIAQKIDQSVLDLAQNVHVPNSQKVAYSTMTNGTMVANDMMNNMDAVPAPSAAAAADAASDSLELFLPLPLWFSQPGNSGAALPIAATPYNDIQIEIDTASSFDNVLMGDASGGSASPNVKFALWANSIVVSNEERSAMACTPRDVLMRQYEHQALASQAKNARVNSSLLFNGALSALYFGARATSVDASGDVFSSVTGGDRSYYGDEHGCSLVTEASLRYENSERLGNMPAGYFELVQPHYHALGSGNNGWRDAGKLMYSFSLDVNSYDHTGYVDFGKLNGVTLETQLSNHGPDLLDVEIVAEKLNVGRFSGGAFGMPVL
jgi:hypothetical protein